MQPPPFWLVWCVDGGTPTVRHEHQALAENEAERLAEANPSKTFVVLAPVSSFVINRVRIERFDLTDLDIPF